MEKPLLGLHKILNMKKSIIPILFLATAAILAADLEVAVPPGGGKMTSNHAGPYTLRGYGKVEVDSRAWQTAEGPVSLACFTAESPEKARIVGSKYLADLLNYGAVSKSHLPGVTLEVRHGGFWKLGLQGKRVMVAVAPTAEALQKAEKAWKADSWKPVSEQAYPRYLDNFDNAALAFWWTPNTKNPQEMQWMRDNPVVANLQEQNLSQAVAPHVLDNSGPSNAAAQLRQLGKPFRTMLWTGDGKATWFSWMNLPTQEFEPYPEGFTGLNYFEAAGYYTNQNATDLLDGLQLNSLFELMNRWKKDPDLMAWMEPHGEFQIFNPTHIPPNVKKTFPAFLQEQKKYDLAAVSQKWTGRPDAYSSWDQVPYPDTAYFAGRRGSYLDLDSIPWKWQPGSLDAGEKAGYPQASFDDSNWFAAKRTSKRLLGYSGVLIERPDNDPKLAGASLWARFDYDIPADFLKEGKPVFLHLMPQTNRYGREMAIWLNGQEVVKKLVDKDVDYRNGHCEVDISKFVKSGANRFVIHSSGGRIAYRVFLSHSPAGKFPFADACLNQQFLDWYDYLRHEKFKTMEKYLHAMRALDPDRPNKVMTPGQWQSDAFDLFEKYGAYPQLTGECNWYRPMDYKGYTMLRDRLSSSEPGGPVFNVPAAQNMFAMAFYESQDCHDYGFDFTRDFWRYPEVVKWWTDNRALLQTFGKTNLERTNLGILRDVNQDSRYASSAIWNWDMARGPLPALGFTPVLVDGPDLIKGLADKKVALLFDCATIITNDAMVEAIKRYVANGGIFVAQHHTGQHSELTRNAWPVPQAFGLKVSNKPVGGEMTFSATQDLFPSLRNSKFSGNGVSITGDGSQSTGAVSITGDKAIPIATWADGSMAIAEVKYGKGRFIMLGTPFYLSFKDDTGKWLNEDSRQKLLQELISSLGIKRDTDVTDPRIWFERRASKNGLYDVYFACAMGWKGTDWKLTDHTTSELAALRNTATAAIDATSAGMPDVATTFGEGKLSFGPQEFSPYQVRQFAVVRDDVGLNGPIHWLKQQEHAWYGLPKVVDTDQKRAKETTEKFARQLGEDGLDISSGWRAQINPTDEAADWLKEKIENWIPGKMGSWLSLGWDQATKVRYRKTIEVPESWRDGQSRVFLGFTSWAHMGLSDTGRLWLNGDLVDSKLPKLFMQEIPEGQLKDGRLDLALEVVCAAQPGKTMGPAGTMYLRRIPRPVATISLNGEWTRLDSMIKENGKITVPFQGKIFGLTRQVLIPKEWEGKLIRLTITEDPLHDRIWGRVGACLINDEGYLREDSFGPIGVRVDRHLKAGAMNTIDLFGVVHDNAADPRPFQADLRSITLEAYPIKP